MRLFSHYCRPRSRLRPTGLARHIDWKREMESERRRQEDYKNITIDLRVR